MASAGERPQFSVVIPTSGRRSLARLLGRLHREDRGDIEVLVVADGSRPQAATIARRAARRWDRVRYWETEPSNDWGNTQRMLGIQRALGRYLIFIDDDDLTTRGAFRIIREAVRANPERIIVFRFIRQPGDTLWKAPELRSGNVSTQQLVIPNLPGKVGSWLRLGRETADFDFLSECVQLQGEPLWRAEIIARRNASPRSRALARMVKHAGKRTVGAIG